MSESLGHYACAVHRGLPPESRLDSHGLGRYHHPIDHPKRVARFMPRMSKDQYFNELVYAAANEDTRSELSALRLTPGDTALCLTGSGARPLELLLGNPGRIVSIDLNPAQNHLLRLKIAAMEVLNYSEYLDFIGVTAGMTPAARAAVLTTLRQGLTPEAWAFWQDRLGLIEQGVIYGGVWEHNLQALAKLGALRSGTIKRLLSCQSLAEQRQIWGASWDGMAWKAMLKVAALRPLWKYVAKEPGIEMVPPDFDLYRYLYGCFDSAANNVLLAEAPFAHLLLKGRYTPEQSLPLHLSAEHFAFIKSNCDRIEIVTASLDAYLGADENKEKFTAFSLSDYSTYCTPEVYAGIWRGILHAAAPGARICERQLFVRLDPGVTAGAKLVRDRELEERLRNEDGTLFYTFICGTISQRSGGYRAS